MQSGFLGEVEKSGIALQNNCTIDHFCIAFIGYTSHSAHVDRILFVSCRPLNYQIDNYKILPK